MTDFIEGLATKEEIRAYITIVSGNQTEKRILW